MCTRFSSATAELSTAINVQICSYSHDESTSEVVWLDSVWMRLKHKEEHNTQHKMLTQEHHSTTIRIYTMANAIAPQRRENATGWRILMYAQRFSGRSMHRSYLFVDRRGHNPYLEDNASARKTRSNTSGTPSTMNTNGMSMISWSLWYLEAE